MNLASVTYIFIYTHAFYISYILYIHYICVCIYIYTHTHIYLCVCLYFPRTRNLFILSLQKLENNMKTQETCPNILPFMKIFKSILYRPPLK